MSDIVNQLTALLTRFVAGDLSGDRFVQALLPLWRRSRDLQDAALAVRPAGAEIRQSRQDLRAGLITPEAHALAVRQAYTQLSDLPIPPGSLLDEALSHLFVEADAFEGDANRRGPDQIDESTLRREAETMLELIRSKG